jgi:DNA-binding transcriptional LysR family regulator
VNDATAALAAAERDEGITIALSYMVAPALVERRLVPVLERFAPAPVPVQIVYPHARLLAPKIRAFVDFAVPWLRRRLAQA